MSLADAIPGGQVMSTGGPHDLAIQRASGLASMVAPVRSALGRLADLAFGTKLGRMAVAGGALALVGKRENIVRNAITGAIVVEGIQEAREALREAPRGGQS